MGGIFHAVGPPGTGKTSYLARQAERAVEKYGPGGITIVSLTRAAATEIASRLPEVERGRIGTLHSICHRATTPGALVMDTPKGIKVWNEWCRERGLSMLLSGEMSTDPDDPMSGREPAQEGESTYGDEMLERMNLFRHTLLDPKAWPLPVQEFAREWADCCIENEATDFTAMIEAGLEMAEAPGNPGVVIADEVQDFSRLEVAVLRRWSANADVSVWAGDEDQAIYNWRTGGGRVFSDAPVEPDNRRVLGQSYRVPLAVHEIARRIVTGNVGRVDAPYLPRDAAGRVEFIAPRNLQPRAAMDPDAWGDMVLDAVRPAEKAGIEDPAHGAMVLATCSYMLDPFLRWLRERGVPYENRYRRKAGKWNPLGGVGRGQASAAEQVVAFAEPEYPDAPVPWSWAQLRLWLPLVQSANGGYLALGAKRRLANSPGEGTPRPEEFAALWASTEDARHALRRDFGWLASVALSSQRKRLEFPIRLIRSRGAGAILRRPLITVGTIHCSPPGEMVRTTSGSVAIEALGPEHRLVGYHRGTNSLLGLGGHHNSRGYEFERSVRHHRGSLVCIETRASRTRVTPNHRVVVRFDEEAFCGRWATYLMRRGSWWRVGICTTAHRPYRAGGVNGRLGTEQADAGWILGVHDSRAEALVSELRIQMLFGLPGTTFEASRARSLPSAVLHEIHETASTHVAERAANALQALGLSAEWPLYRRGFDSDGKSKRNLRGWFVTEAANLVALSGRVAMATCSGGERRPKAERASVSVEQYDGPVYGLDVPPHHYYVSGGAVVHNSVKGGEADHVFLLTDLPGRWGTAGDDRDEAALARLFYVGATRARETLTILESAGGYEI